MRLAVGCFVVASAFEAGRIHAHEALRPTPEFQELTATLLVDEDVRIHVNAPAADPAREDKPSRLIVYALPNGNTLEQTLGCRMAPGLDWHYDIQHVAAQTRLLRKLLPQERIVLVCAEAKGLSWPAWRASRRDPHSVIAQMVEQWRTEFAGPGARVTLTGHSGGGGFMFSVVEAGEDIPPYIDRIAFLDANYNFDAEVHAAKFTRWLKADASRRLLVLAYDDRKIELNGKRVVGPTGGTFRATRRMVEGLEGAAPLTKSEGNPFIEYEGLGGRVHFWVHRNPENKILHTALVGEMNGLVHIQTLGAEIDPGWGRFGGPRAYGEFIQASPEPPLAADATATPQGEGPASTKTPKLNIPPRPEDGPTGSEFADQIRSLDPAAREAAILREALRGNVPPFQRALKAVPITGQLATGETIAATLYVLPDMLAVGSDDDFLRMPMRPATAQKIADEYGAALPTRKIVDAIDAAATVRLAPQPLTQDRESVAAFVLSNDKIEAQRGGKPLGELVTGAKKDIVVSNKIHERPDRVVIYGWRQLDGRPIQPLSSVHVDWYVDYSHGVRLVRNEIVVNGRALTVNAVVADPSLHPLLSDEGPISPPRYPGDE